MMNKPKKIKETEYVSCVFSGKTYERLTDVKKDPLYAQNPERGSATFFFKDQDGALFFGRKALLTSYEIAHLKDAILMPPHIQNLLWPTDMIYLEGNEVFFEEMTADLTHVYTSISDTKKGGSYVLLLFAPQRFSGLKNLSSLLTQKKEENPAALSFESAQMRKIALSFLKLLYKLRSSGWLTWDFELSRFFVTEEGDVWMDFSVETRPYLTFCAEGTEKERTFDGNRTAVYFSEPFVEQAFIRGEKSIVGEPYINYGIAAVLFYLFIGRLPFDGAFMDGTREDSPLLRSQKFQRYYLNPVFIFDEKNGQNGLSPDFADEQVASLHWKTLPKMLSDYFYLLFTATDHEDVVERAFLNAAGWIRLLDHGEDWPTFEDCVRAQYQNPASKTLKTYYYPLLRSFLNTYGKENLLDVSFMGSEMERYDLFTQSPDDLLRVFTLSSVKTLVNSDECTEERFLQCVSEFYQKTFLFENSVLRPVHILSEIADAVFGLQTTEKTLSKDVFEALFGVTKKHPELLTESQKEVNHIYEKLVASTFGHDRATLVSECEILSGEQNNVGLLGLLYCAEQNLVGNDVLWDYVPEEKKQETGFFGRTFKKAKNGVALILETIREAGYSDETLLFVKPSFDAVRTESALGDDEFAEVHYGIDRRVGVLYAVEKRKDGTYAIELRKGEGGLFDEEEYEKAAPQILVFGITEEEFSYAKQQTPFAENSYLNELLERLLKYLPEDRFLKAYAVRSGLQEVTIHHRVPSMDGGGYATQVREGRLFAFTSLPAIYLVEKQFGEEHYPSLDKEDRIVCFEGRREAEDYIREEELRSHDAIAYTQEEFREKAAILLNDGVRSLVLRKKNMELQAISLTDIVPDGAKHVASFQADLALQVAVAKKSERKNEEVLSEEMEELARKLQEAVLFVPLYFGEAQPQKSKKNAIYVTANAQASLDRRHMTIDNAAKDMEIINLDGGFLPFKADDFIGAQDDCMAAWTDLRGEEKADAYLLGNYYEVSQRVFKTLDDVSSGMLRYRGLSLVSGRTKCEISISDLKHIDLFLYGKARKCANEK